MEERRRNRGWIWYFVILALLTITSVTIMIAYNKSQQLKPEQLAVARALWAEKGPADYDMEYTQIGSASGTIDVKVRNGVIVSATLDGRPLDPAQHRYYDMRGLFNSIDGFLEHDQKPGQPRTFTKATFSAQDGHVIRYIRRVPGSSERLEINVKLRPVEKSAAGLAEHPTAGDNRP
jgi:hypothetical protein